LSDYNRLVFAVQIGLEREAVTVALDGYAEFTMSTLTEIACAFVDRKVCETSLIIHCCLITTSHNVQPCICRLSAVRVISVTIPLWNSNA